MSDAGHLLLVALGPVQDFIAQARRTRDLWYGSHLLSEISKAAARALRDAGAELVFPAVRTEADLAPHEEPVLPDETVPLNVANKILAVVPAGVDVEQAARAARSGAFARLRAMADRVRAKARIDGLLAQGCDESWDEQIRTLIEFTACWAALGNGDDAYVAARNAVEDALAGRKALREFVPWTRQREGVPKSSLDGARETVLREMRKDEEPRRWRELRISRGEQLDAVGLVKRAGGRPEQFVPVANVALAAWIAEAERCCEGALAGLRKACGDVGIPAVYRPKLGWIRAFPFDAHVFHRERWRPLFEERDISSDEKWIDDWGDKHVAPVLKDMPRPHPYVACLVADGDRMGLALDDMKAPKQHQDFSRALAGFAEEARRVVERDQYRGVLVYSGGDDVLAFVCLPDALACAAALREAFDACMEKALGRKHELPTLSVGLGIGHLMDEMGHLLRLGRQAERHAKHAPDPGQERNALAIVVDKRSGPETVWRAQWNDGPVQRLQEDVRLLHAGAVSTGKIFEIRSLLRRLPPPEDVPEAESEDWANLLSRDTQRTLSRMESPGGVAHSAKDLGMDLGQRAYPAIHASVDAWINRALVARVFASAAIHRKPAPAGAAA